MREGGQSRPYRYDNLETENSDFNRGSSLKSSNQSRGGSFREEGQNLEKQSQVNRQRYSPTEKYPSSNQSFFGPLARSEEFNHHPTNGKNYHSPPPQYGNQPIHHGQEGHHSGRSRNNEHFPNQSSDQVSRPRNSNEFRESAPFRNVPFQNPHHIGYKYPHPPIGVSRQGEPAFIGYPPPPPPPFVGSINPQYIDHLQNSQRTRNFDNSRRRSRSLSPDRVDQPYSKYQKTESDFGMDKKRYHEDRNYERRDSHRQFEYREERNRSSDKYYSEDNYRRSKKHENNSGHRKDFEDRETKTKKEIKDDKEQPNIEEKKNKLDEHQDVKENQNVKENQAKSNQIEQKDEEPFDDLDPAYRLDLQPLPMTDDLLCPTCVKPREWAYFSLCDECPIEACSSCIVRCYRCNFSLCPNCSFRCAKCKYASCGSCCFYCFSCQNISCENCTFECESCGTLCMECVSAYNQGAKEDNRFCPQCITKISKKITRKVEEETNTKNASQENIPSTKKRDSSTTNNTLVDIVFDAGEDILLEEDIESSPVRKSPKREKSSNEKENRRESDSRRERQRESSNRRRESSSRREEPSRRDERRDERKEDSTRRDERREEVSRRDERSRKEESSSRREEPSRKDDIIRRDESNNGREEQSKRDDTSRKEDSKRDDTSRRDDVMRREDSKRDDPKRNEPPRREETKREDQSRRDDPIRKEDVMRREDTSRREEPKRDDFPRREELNRRDDVMRREDSKREDSKRDDSKRNEPPRREDPSRRGDETSKREELNRREDLIRREEQLKREELNRRDEIIKRDESSSSRRAELPTSRREEPPKREDQPKRDEISKENSIRKTDEREVFKGLPFQRPSNDYHREPSKIKETKDVLPQRGDSNTQSGVLKPPPESHQLNSESKIKKKDELETKPDNSSVRNPIEVQKQAEQPPPKKSIEIAQSPKKRITQMIQNTDKLKFAEEKKEITLTLPESSSDISNTIKGRTIQRMQKKDSPKRSPNSETKSENPAVASQVSEEKMKARALRFGVPSSSQEKEPKFAVPEVPKSDTTTIVTLIDSLLPAQPSQNVPPKSKGRGRGGALWGKGGRW